MKLEQLEAKVEKSLLSQYEERAGAKMNPFVEKGLKIVTEIGLAGILGGLLVACFAGGPALISAVFFGVMPMGIGLLGLAYATGSYINLKTAQKDIAEDIKSGVYQQSFAKGLTYEDSKVEPEEKKAFDDMVAGISTKFDYAAALKEAETTPLTLIADFSKAAGKSVKDKGLSIGKVIKDKGFDLSGRIKKKSLNLVNTIKKIGKKTP